MKMAEELWTVVYPDLVSWWDTTWLADWFNRIFDCSIRVSLSFAIKRLGGLVFATES